MRFSLKWLLAAVAVLSLLLGIAIWNSRWERCVIHGSELAKEQTLHLSTTTEYGITIRVKGELDGTSTLILPWDDTRMFLGPGSLSQYVQHDFYDAKTGVKYLPGTTKSGRLIIEYDFW